MQKQTLPSTRSSQQPTQSMNPSKIFSRTQTEVEENFDSEDEEVMEIDYNDEDDQEVNDTVARATNDFTPQTRQKLSLYTSTSNNTLHTKELIVKDKESKFPPVPSWTHTRLFLNYGHLAEEVGSPNSFSPLQMPSPNMYSTVNSTNKTSLDLLPLNVQESVITEDLLFVMMGIEGKYIKKSNDTRGFVVEPTLDICFSDLIQRILPLCTHYIGISHFLDTHHTRFESGLVTHALCAGIKGLLKEYFILIAQLEHQLRQGKLTLQRVWFYIQPSLRTMELIHGLVAEIVKQKCTGGSLLNVIFHQSITLGSDQQSIDLFGFLMQKASAPYHQMLEAWIYEGVINDPYAEFMIEEHTELQKNNGKEDFEDTYWAGRYTIRDSQTPTILTRVAQKVLTTGKYLNVVLECRRDSKKVSQSEDIKSHRESSSKAFLSPSQEREYTEKIEKAYQFASKTLLSLLMGEKQLMAHLRSIKHYFLLDQGDFFVHFMDLAFDDLKKPVAEISLAKIRSLLELSLRTAISENDPYKDNLVCEFLPYNLLTQLLRVVHLTSDTVQLVPSLVASPLVTASTANLGQTISSAKENPMVNPAGFEAFTFDYKVSWPLSLVITPKSLLKYQLIFRYLFYCRYVEKQICIGWVALQTVKNIAGIPLVKKALHRVYCLRSHMLHFLQNIQHYIMFEVLEPNWHKLDLAIRGTQTTPGASTVDEVFTYHTAFLDTCLKECTLTDSRFVKLLTKIMMICFLFANYTIELTNTLSVDSLGERELSPRLDIRAKGKAPQKTNKAARTSLSPTLEKVTTEQVSGMLSNGDIKRVDTYEQGFYKHLKHLMDALKSYSNSESNEHMIHLIPRLDYNQF
eukprot:TRINITY_DN15026_c0_g1_i1.p1 TRINITY_DN15026_c0_g1~~TRINITY_DN15026_c0_g1_i1.p1  ORF type:complete len:854 (-),score=186.01 TRINITY_DN15026_c0_g1_i1:181-2742(-)